jgi:hypothetical protein
MITRLAKRDRDQLVEALVSGLKGDAGGEWKRRFEEKVSELARLKMEHERDGDGWRVAGKPGPNVSLAACGDDGIEWTIGRKRGLPSVLSLASGA